MSKAANTVKPLYAVPSMADIATIPWNGFNVVSTFSGCGGSCLGYRMAGFRVVWASEVVPAAQNAYRANHQGFLDTRDIRQVQPADILNATGLDVGEIDIFDGSPPCQAFSTCGQGSKAWGTQRKYGDATQANENMFFEYARLLDGLQPRAFIAENVAGLVRGHSIGYFKMILKALQEAGTGYTVEARVLDAQWLGVPQTRTRLVIQGVRSDLGRKPAFPSPLPYRYSVRDACPFSFPEMVRPYHTYRGKRNAKPATVAPPPGFHIEPEAWLKPHLAYLKYWQETKVGRSHHARFTLNRLHPEQPAPCVISQGMDTYHSYEPRRLSLFELRRVCGFPDDFVLPGSFSQGWARLGNAVPPLMMRAIATAVRDGVLA